MAKDTVIFSVIVYSSIYHNSTILKVKLNKNVNVMCLYELHRGIVGKAYCFTSLKSYYSDREIQDVVKENGND